MTLATAIQIGAVLGSILGILLISAIASTTFFLEGKVGTPLQQFVLAQAGENSYPLIDRTVTFARFAFRGFLFVALSYDVQLILGRILIWLTAQ